MSNTILLATIVTEAAGKTTSTYALVDEASEAAAARVAVVDVNTAAADSSANSAKSSTSVADDAIAAVRVLSGWETPTAGTRSWI
jgi:hypothetical protein